MKTRKSLVNVPYKPITEAIHNSHQRRIERYVATSDALSFLNQLTSPDLLDTLESTTA